MMIKNYTTTIAAIKTVSEIEEMLVEHGAKGIIKLYGDNGIVEAVMFSINTKHGEIGFKLPCEFRKLQKKLTELRNQQKITISWAKVRDFTHAQNVGWRIIKDWIQVQLSFIQIGLVEFDQVFLPYAYSQVTNKTFYESLKDEGFKYLLGEEK